MSAGPSGASGAATDRGTGSAGAATTALAAFAAVSAAAARVAVRRLPDAVAGNHGVAARTAGATLAGIAALAAGP
ncbi:hypothetical protein, partial [Mycobacterium tuberculosis]|uniref:hypothetical protein n=1 Tax=Mycobacterium tuberculosis TaxID=1773 RepID=UPI0022350A26